MYGEFEAMSSLSITVPYSSDLDSLLSNYMAFGIRWRAWATFLISPSSVELPSLACDTPHTCGVWTNVWSASYRNGGHP